MSLCRLKGSVRASLPMNSVTSYLFSLVAAARLIFGNLENLILGDAENTPSFEAVPFHHS